MDDLIDGSQVHSVRPGETAVGNCPGLVDVAGSQVAARYATWTYRVNDGFKNTARLFQASTAGGISSRIALTCRLFLRKTEHRGIKSNCRAVIVGKSRARENCLFLAVVAATHFRDLPL